MPRHLKQSSGFAMLGNPYVVLADLLVATFFVVVLHVQAERLSQADPTLRQIETFKLQLATDIRKFWGASIEDEGKSGSGRAGVDSSGKEPQEIWWSRLPPTANLILKQDASYVKLVLYGGSEAMAVFPKRSTVLTPRGRGLVQQIARNLAESQAAQRLAERRAIVAINIEGHCGDEGWKSGEDAWAAAVNRAQAVRRVLESEGARMEAPRLSANPGVAAVLSPGRFSVQGRGIYQNLPYLDARGPAQRRVQVEIRFTQRYSIN